MLNRYNRVAPHTKHYDTGGQIEPLLAPVGTGRMEEEVGPDPLLPLAELLGPNDANEMYEAIDVYPVVEKIAMMATQTSDGVVSGMGTGTSDEVPALVSAGEYIISAEAVQVIGLDNLEAMHEEAKRLAASS